jgi:hypothetical protein
MANEAIIKAAGAAYSPVKGQYDISGFVQGAAAIATGLVKRKAEADKLKSSVDKLSVPTDIAQVGNLVEITKSKIIDKELTMGDGVKSLKSVEYDVKQVIPKINSVLAKLEEKGLSLSVSGIDENYTTALKLGELNKPVSINGNDVDLFYDVDDKNQLVMLSPEGDMVRPNVLLARLENMTTSDAKEPANSLLIKMIGSDFTPGSTSKFASTKDAINTSLNSLFEDKKLLYSFLLDNPNGFSVTDKNDITTTKKFTEYYLAKGLEDIVDESTGQSLLDKFNTEIRNISSADAREKAKAMIIKNLMDEDPSLREDVQGFLDGIYELKKPGQLVVENIISEETATGFKITGKLNQSESQDFTVVNSVEGNMEAAIKKIKDNEVVEVGGVQQEAMGGKVQLLRLEDAKDAPGVPRFQWTQNMYGEEDANNKPKMKYLSNDFFINPKHNAGISASSYRTIMQQLITNVPNGVSYGSRVYNSYNNHLNSRIQPPK